MHTSTIKFKALLLNLFLLGLWGCQSLGSYAPICQSDEECEDYQICDRSLNACVLEPAYDMTPCDPAARYDRCPTATSCDAESGRCLPRKLRVAWVFSFDSNIYSRRQTANLIEFLTTYISSTYFDALTCDAAEDLPHVLGRCASEEVEYIFVDTGDELESYAEQIREAYREAPFDLALTYFSSGYSLTNEVRAQHELGFFTIGRVNRRADRVEAELEPDFRYPPLEERYDVSLTVLGEDQALPDYLFNKIFCDNPLMVYEDNEPYRLDRLLYERTWAKHGECLDYMVVPRELKARYDDVVGRIKDQDHDCVYMHQVTAWLPTLLKDYADASSPSERDAISWLFRRSRIDSGSENALEARRLVEMNYPDSTHTVSYRSDRTNYEPFVQNLEVAYRAFLEEKECLGLPQITCDELDCSAPADEVEAMACEQLECALGGEQPSCLELGCYVSEPAQVCQRIQCPLISSTCDYYEPNFLRNGEGTVSVIADMILATQLLSLKHRYTPLENRPVSRETFRDFFFELTAEQNACGLPDISACTRQIEKDARVELQYSGLRGPWNFTPDGRIRDSQTVTVLEKFNGQTFSPSVAYTPAQKDNLAERDDSDMVICPDP